MLLGRRELEVEAPGSVYATMYGADGRIIVHLVNETGERPLKDTIPVRDITVNVALPEGARVSSVRAAVEEQNIAWRQEEGRAEVKLDQVDVWEMVVVEFE